MLHSLFVTYTKSIVCVSRYIQVDAGPGIWEILCMQVQVYPGRCRSWRFSMFGSCRMEDRYIYIWFLLRVIMLVINFWDIFSGKIRFYVCLGLFWKWFFGKNRMLSGSVLYMWTALCKKLLDVLAESDLYLTDGFRTCRSISDLAMLWYNNCDREGGWDSYEILCTNLIDSCIIIWW